MNEFIKDISIVSIVATGTINTEIDLEALSNDIEAYSSEYNPDQSPGLYVKFNEGSPTITIYRTGSFNIRGGSSYEEIDENRMLLKQRLADLGIDTIIEDTEVTNIVFSGDLKTKFYLNKLAIKLGLESVEYEPEQFPGLVYRVNSGVLLIFSSGKLILTGFTDIDEAQKAYDELIAEIDNG